MKTTGLNFLEAMKALKEGKCKGIRNSVGTIYKINEYGIVAPGLQGGIETLPEIYLGAFSLVDVKPRTEERILKYWIVVWKDGLTPSIFYNSLLPPGVRNMAQQVIPTVTGYTYTFPETEEEECE